MNRNRKSASSWSDLDKAWDSVAELKQELYKTDLKLKHAARNTFIWDDGPSNQPDKTVTKLPVTPKPLKYNEKRRKIYSKSMKTHSKIERRKNEDEKSRTATVSHSEYEQTSSEDRPQNRPSRTSTQDPKEMRQKIIESALNNAILRISSDEASVSSNYILRNHKASDWKNPESFVLRNHSTQTIADATARQGKEVPSTLNPRKVIFSPWEKEFLNKELSDFETSEKSSVVLQERNFCSLNDPDDNKQSLLKRPEFLPEKRKPSSQQTNKVTSIDGFKKLKEIVERQREKNDQLLSEIDSDHFVNENISTNQKSSKDGFLKTSNAAESMVREPRTVPKMVDEEVQVKPVPVRKVCTVPRPSEYRGFSAVDSSLSKLSLFSAERVYNCKSPMRSKGVEITGRNTNKPKRLRKTVDASKEFITPFSWREGQKLVMQKLGSPHRSTTIQRESKNTDDQTDTEVDSSFNMSPSHSSPIHLAGNIKTTINNNKNKTIELTDSPDDKITNSTNDDKINDSQNPEKHPVHSQKTSEEHSDEEIKNETIDLTDSPPSKDSDPKGDNKENDSPDPQEHLIAAQRILQELADKESEEDSADEENILSQQKSSAFVKQHHRFPLSKKRKATKQPEQKSPAPKIRHYDPEKVRAYIEKQKAQRKKKLQEERQKKIQQQQAKKERLQQLYDYQKLAAQTVKTVVKPKTVQPLKLLHDNIKIIKRVDEPQKITTPKIIHPKENSVDGSQTKVHSDEQIQLTDDKMATDADVEPNNSLEVKQEQMQDKKFSSAHQISSPDKIIERKSPNKKEPKIGVRDNFEVKLKGEDKLIAETKIKPQSSALENQHHVDSLSGVSSLKSVSSLPHLDDDNDTWSSFKSSQVEPIEVVPSEAVVALRNLALSIQNQVDIGTQHLQGILRAKQWVETRPSASLLNSSSSSDELEEGPLESSPEVNTKVGDTSERTKSHSSFMEQLPGVGNVHELFSKLMERTDNIYTKPFNTDFSHGDNQKILSSSELGANFMEDDDVLIEGPLDPLEEMSLFKSETVIPTSLSHISSVAILDFSKPRFQPDPFNFINTWSRKPLAIETFPYEVTSQLKGQDNVDSSLQFPVIDANGSQVGSSKEKDSYSSDFIESENRSTESKISVDHQSSDASTIQNVNVSNSQSKEQSEASIKSVSSVSQINKEHTSSAVTSELDISEDNEISEHASVKSIDSVSNKLSPSNSVVSKIHSLIEGSLSDDEHIEEQNSVVENVMLNTHQDTVSSEDSQSAIDENSLNSDLKTIIPSEVSNDYDEQETESKERSEDNGTLQTGTTPDSKTSKINKSDELENKDSANAISFNESDSNFFTSTGLETASSIASPNTLGVRMHSELEKLDNVQESLLHVAELRQIHGIAGAMQENTIAQILEEKNETKEQEDSVTNQENSSNGKEVIHTKQDSSKFSVPETRTKTSEIPEVTHSKIQKNAQYPSDPFLDSNTVTRVATEVATAAATSAVIAVLESQKALLGQKHFLELMEMNATPSKHRTTPYSSNFENSQDSNSQSVLSQQLQSVGESLKPSTSTVSKESDHSSVPEVLSNGDSLEEQSVIEELQSTLHDQTGSSGSLPNSANPVHEGVISSGIPENISTTDSQHETSVEKKRKRSGNVSSPSPASLSDNESLPSTVVSSSNSALSHSSQLSDDFHSFLSEDSFAQLTLDMVRRMTHEEELRARHQLSLLQFQEKALVEKARAEMRWLELLKKKLREKGAEKKLPVIKKRQQELVLRLRQERAQLRCMQETYRSVSKKHQALLAEKKKLLTEPSSLAFQILNRKEKSIHSAPSSQDRVSEIVSHVQSTSSSSTPSVTTEEDNDIVQEERSPDIPEAIMNTSNISSTESMVESQFTIQSKVSQSSIGKLKPPQTATSRHPKLEPTNPRLSQHSSHSLESILQGLKRLEASKRHLTKREQRLLQRRKHVESLLQWQNQLDSEEKEVKELEKQALEIVDNSKFKTKYYVSSSPTSPPNDTIETYSKKHSSLVPTEKITVMSTDQSPDSIKEVGLSLSVQTESELGESSSVPEENLPPSDISIAEINNSSEIKLSSTVDEMLNEVQQTSSDSYIKEETIDAHSSNSNNIIEDIASSLKESPISITEDVNSTKSNISPSAKDKMSISSAEAYSESFESTSETHNTSSSPAESKNIRSINNGRKDHNITIRSPLMPRNHRRHDSSGSDDSYTISHSETASDQSDIEGRIYALTEELRRRKAEAEKLRKEQKRRYREQLKEKEVSLQKQLEAYDLYIQEARTELEQQLEAAASPPSLDHSVKPQIKQPRVAKSRRLRKQASLSPDSDSSVDKKADEAVSSGSDTKDVSLPIPKEIKPLSSITHLAKKLKAIEPKEEAEIHAEESTHTSTVINELISQTHSQISEEITSSYDYSENTSQKHSQSAEVFDQEEKTSTTASQKVVENLKPNLSDSNQSYSTEFTSSETSVQHSPTVLPEESNENANNTVSNKTLSPNKKNEGSLFEDSVEDLADESDKSSSSNKTLQNESANSTEGESISDSHSVINDFSVEEEIEITEENVNKCDGSDGCCTPSPKNVCNETFLVEEEEKTCIEEEEQEILVVEICETTFVIEDVTSNKAEHSQEDSELCEYTSEKVPIYDKKMESDEKCQKIERLATDITDSLITSFHEETVSLLLSISSKFQKVVQNDAPSNQTSLKTNLKMSLTSIHEKAALQVSETLTSSLLKDAIQTILNIFKSNNSHQVSPPKSMTCEKVVEIEENVSIEKMRTQDSIVSVAPPFGDVAEFGWGDTAQTAFPSPEHELPSSSDTTIIKTNEVDKSDQHDDVTLDQEWKDDDLVPVKNETQLLLSEQEAIKMYPYYYRQIPNKPPPPYTPPSSVPKRSKYGYSENDVNKSIETVNVIPDVIERLNEAVEDCVTKLLEGKQQGIPLKDIKQAQCQTGVEGMTLVGQNQIIFRTFVFELTREMALKVYSEKEEDAKPWFKNRKLTPKPLFPMEKSKLIPTLQQEVRQVMKLSPAWLQPNRDKQSMWSAMKLGRKKRDFVDTIIISELKDEEPEWVNYDEDEFAVKIQLSNSIFNVLIDDTVRTIRNMDRKMKLSVLNPDT